MNHLNVNSECESIAIQVNPICLLWMVESATTSQTFCLENSLTTRETFQNALDTIQTSPSFTINDVEFELSLASVYEYKININDVLIVLDNEASRLFYRFWFFA